MLVSIYPHLDPSPRRYTIGVYIHRTNPEVRMHQTPDLKQAHLPHQHTVPNPIPKSKQHATMPRGIHST